MKIIRFFLRWLTSVLLHVSIGGLVLGIVLSMFFTTPERPLSVLQTSGVYDDLVPTFVDELAREAIQSPQSLPLDDSVIQQTIIDNFTSESIRTGAEALVTGIYDWLQGDTASIEFRVDYTEQKDRAIEQISSYGVQRLEGLPPCTQEELNAVTALNLQCQPPGFYEQIVSDAVTEDLQASGLLEDPVLTPAILPDAEDGRSLEETLALAPTIYGVFAQSLLLFALLFVLASALFIMARKPYRKGFSAYGRDLIGSGVSIVLLTLVFGFLLPRVEDTLQFQSSGIAGLFDQVFDAFRRQIDIVLINSGLYIAVGGLIIMVIARMTRPTASTARTRMRSSGLVTSEQSKKANTAETTTQKRPPLQTSEGVKKPRKKQPKKYTI